MQIEVVENPRRRRRRYTAKQRAYGFGGKRRRRPATRRRRRRNPMLASLAANPRRRRRRGSYAVTHRVRRRRRNPKLFGLKGFDFGAAMYVGIGMIGSDMVPNLVRKAWSGLPSSGPMVYLVRAGGTLATAYAVKMATRSEKNFSMVMAGGLGLILVDLFRMYVAPKIGLSGLAADSSVVYAGEVADAYNMGRYIDTMPLSSGNGVGKYVNVKPGRGVAGYRNNPIGAY